MSEEPSFWWNGLHVVTTIELNFDSDPTAASDLWYYRFFVKSADLSRFRPFSDFTGRSVPKNSAPNQTEGRLGRHPPVWGDAKLWWVWKIRGRRGKGVGAPA